MDQGPPESKRPRLSTGSGWSAGPHRVSLFHPSPSPTSTQLPAHPPPPPPPPPPSAAGQYQPSHPFSRPPEHHPPPPQPPLHPPHPLPPAANHLDDRRHHEPDRYPPMQEHRQLPPSPAHPPFSGYPPPRDPMVKPDPADDALPQLRRPHSTGAAPESIPGAAPPHPVLPPHAHQDDRRQMSFDAGPQGPLYRQPSYPPQTPMPPAPPYDYHPQSYGGPHDMSYSIPITATGKRKAQRASQACDSCRQLKAKCDETKPCKSCKEKKLECKYRDPAPKQQDKVAADILDGILRLQTDFARMDRRMRRLERALHKSTPNPDLTAEPSSGDDGLRPGSVGSIAPLRDDASAASSLADSAGGPDHLVDQEPAPIGPFEARKIARQIVDDDEMEVEPGPPVLPGAPAIPLNHTTLAALLLKWKSIWNLVQHHLDRENVRYIDEFPIRQEERRGLLRLFGRGEGQDSARGDRDSSLDQGVTTDNCDGYSDAGAPSPADCWGAIGGLTPPSTISGKPPLVTPNLDFSELNVWKYVKSYEENIQNMHPLIIPHELYAMVRVFLDNVQSITGQSKGGKGGDGGAGGGAAIAKFVAPSTAPPQQPETGSKRKRQSPGPESADPTVSSPKSAKPTFQRSIQNALVLLVLALGKICLWRDRKIPEPVAVSDPVYGSPLVRNGHPASPLQGSPPSNASQSHSSGLPSPKENMTSSRRASFQGTPIGSKGRPSPKRNADVIPGLNYFAIATDILGGQLAGATLRHVYANILAGLYHGQLGRVMESYAYIKQASYSLQIKMRPSLDRFARLQENFPFHPTAITEKNDNQLIVAFWSCLQLESDIIAELPLPQSNILAYENLMPYPNLELARNYGFDIRVLHSYHAQLYLRKKLNEIHKNLYDPMRPQVLPPPQPRQDFDIFAYLQEALDMRFVPPEFKFEPDEPPARDILSARLRAKYWGAQVITFRPFVKQILDFNSSRSVGEAVIPVSDSSYQVEFTGPTIGPDVKQENDINPWIVEYAAKGIRALVESTRAFHGLEDKRFVVTNVFGTAHAQWGNLLTLSAIYKDPTLNKYIHGATLRDLFEKTISFFQIIAHSSSALMTDMRILEGLRRELFFSRPGDLAETGRTPSFSSNTATGAPQMPPMTPSAPAPPNTHPPGSSAEGILAPPLPVQHPL